MVRLLVVMLGMQQCAEVPLPAYVVVCFVHQLLGRSNIHSTIWLQTADDNAMCPQGTASLDVSQHDLREHQRHG